MGSKKVSIVLARISVLGYTIKEINYMATRCPQCGKGSRMVTTRVLLRGHYNPTSKSRRYPNLQWAKVNGKRIKICTDCIKTLNKTR